MLSFDLISDKSVPIAIIHGKRKDNVLFLTDDCNFKKIGEGSSSEESSEIEGETFKSISLDNYKERFSILPNIYGGDKIFLAGPSGSGKSSIIASYLTDFKKLFPDKKIYLFSDVDEDPILDDVGGINRIPLDTKFVEEPIHPEELKNSCCVFDDIDSCQVPAILKAVMTLRDAILRRGRHELIEHVIITSHLLTDYKSTRCVLSEASQIVVFPSSGSTNSLNYLLKNYVGIPVKQIPVIKGLPSRWVSLRIRFPQLIITENQCMLLSELDESKAKKKVAPPPTRKGKEREVVEEIEESEDEGEEEELEDEEEEDDEEVEE